MIMMLIINKKGTRLNRLIPSIINWRRHPDLNRTIMVAGQNRRFYSPELSTPLNSIISPAGTVLLSSVYITK
jgi:hypothetical protein